MTAFKYAFLLAVSLTCQASQAAPLQAPEPQAPSAQLSAQDERLIRIMARKDVVGGILSPKASDCLNLANKLDMLPSYPQP